MIIPPFLHKGDLIRIISPAGSIDSDLIKGSEDFLISWGLQVLRGVNASNQEGRFAGNDKQRLNDLQEALDDPKCKAILCSRGGYGTIRLIDKINLDAFRKSPKWLIGYSDITMLHALLQMEGYASIHGGMAKMLSGQLYPEPTGTNPEPAILLHDILWGSLPEYTTQKHPLNRLGEVSGTLTGGNLSILYSLRGTPYDHIPEGSILLIEDIGEKPYVIDRIMHNLKLGGILKRIAGLIVGQFTDYDEDPEFGMSVTEIISEAVSDYTYPVCFDFPSGHVERNLPFIEGGTVKLNVTENGAKLSYKEI